MGMNSQGHTNRARSTTPGLSICRPLISLHTLFSVSTPGFGRLYLITKSGDTTLLLEPKFGANYFKLAWERFVNRVESCGKHEAKGGLKRAAGCLGIPIAPRLLSTKCKKHCIGDEDLYDMQWTCHVLQLDESVGRVLQIPKGLWNSHYPHYSQHYPHETTPP